MNQYGDVASGDTTNVWKNASALVLSTYQPYNYHSFEIPVDTAFHKGDKLILDFESQFLYQDGMRDGIAMLAITLKNDSVISNTIRITSSQHYMTELEDRDSIGIKSVKGYFLLNRGDFVSGSSSSTTLKLMFIENIKLVRMHARKPVTPENPDASMAPTPPGGPRPVLSSPTGRPLPPNRLEKIQVETDGNRPRN